MGMQTMLAEKDSYSDLLASHVYLRVPLAGLLQQRDPSEVGGLRPTLPRPTPQHGHQLRL